MITKTKKHILIAIIITALAGGGFWIFHENNSNHNNTPTVVGPFDTEKAAVEKNYNSAKDIKGKYEVKGAALTIPAKDKNSVAVELGDPGKDSLSPDLKLSRWNGEVKFQMKPDLSGIPENEKTVTFEGEKIRYQTPKTDYVFYDKPDASDEGGYEFEQILKEKPASNVFEIPIESENLNFFYQPPLNQGQNLKDKLKYECTETECKDRKSGKVMKSMPENVVGSYAVYYKDKRSGDYTALGGKNYKAGKAFHIYRPQIIDAMGKKVWGRLSIDAKNDKMAIVVPQNFLDTAAYPVIVYPTFGYTVEGAESTSLSTDGGNPSSAEFRLGNVYVVPGGGKLSSISAYLYEANSASSAKVFVNKKDSEGSGSHGQIATATLSNIPADYGWRTFALNNEPISASEDYILSIVGQNVGLSIINYDVVDWHGTGSSAYMDNFYTGANWATATSYGVGAVVIHNGRAYFCTFEHTSSSDNEPGVGANWQSYWRDDGMERGYDHPQDPWNEDAYIEYAESILANMIQQSSPWNIGTQYPVFRALSGNTYEGFSINNGHFYTCMVAHIASSDNEPGVGANWQTYWTDVGEAPLPTPQWESATSYTVYNNETGDGSVVINNYGDYLCILDHISSSENEPGVGSNWQNYWALNSQSITAQLSLYATYTDSMPVYYSVGQTAGDLKTGTPTVTITNGAAVFSAAQTGNIGVGDRVTYDTDKVAYIAAKTNADKMHWTLVTATGSAPPDISSSTVVSIKHEYTSLSAAIAGASDANHLNTSDLTSGYYALNIPCYYDSGADTTAVTISGYTTSSANYIKVYTPTSTTTEANFSQRHQGRWDGSKYNLRPPASTSAVNSQINFITIDGLQILVNSSTTGNTFGISLTAANGSVNQVSNNMIQGVFSGSANNIKAGVYNAWAASGTKTLKLWNNIIYGFVNGGNSSLYGFSNNKSWTTYAYNNTIYNSYNSFSPIDGLVYAKNNIAQNTTRGFGAVYFDSSSDYNISDKADTPGSPGSHNKNSATVQFVDAAHGDFHLAQNDTAARNAGADLSADANLPFSTDIDGHTRGNLGGWDIGADEGAAYIYYSVGQNTSDHKTGSPTITLSGYNASLSVAQTAPNMGVGDLITYTGGSCYISGKTDTQHWTCQNATGGTAPQVSGVSVTSIAHAFSSLANAVNYGNSTQVADSSHLNLSVYNVDIASNNYVVNIPCYYDTGSDIGGINITPWKTSPSNYLRIYTPTNTNTEVNVSQRHSGKWDPKKYSLTLAPSTGATAITISDINNIKIDGLQIYFTGPTQSGENGISSPYPAAGNRIEISNNIITGSINNYVTGISMKGYYAPIINSYVYNNIIYDLHAVNVGTSTGITVDGSLGHVYNNTVINSDSCYAGGMLKNNIAQSCTIASYSGTIDPASINNASDHATSAESFGVSVDSGTTTSSGPPGSKKLIQSGKQFTRTVRAGMVVKNTTNNTYSFVKSIDSDTMLTLNDDITPASGRAYTIYTNRYGTVSFANTANKDFHLAGNDTVAKKQGINLSADPYLWFETDIDGDLRSGEWSIGADNGAYAQAGGTDDVNQNATRGLDYGLVMYQPFNGKDISSTTSFDRSGKNNNGTISGATPTTGIKGQAMSFNGSSNYINSNYNYPGSINALTISAWIKYNSSNNAYGTVVGYRYDSNNKFGLRINGNGANAVISFMIDKASTKINAVSSSSVLPRGEWHNITGVFDGANTSSIYMDGNLVASSNNVEAPSNSFSGLLIGSDASQYYFGGDMDELRIYNRALSPNEIGDLYRQDYNEIVTQQNNEVASGLVGYWAFNGTDVNPNTNAIADKSGQNNNGTNNGAKVVPGKIGQALSFNGSSNYALVPVGGSVPQSITLSAWIYPTAGGVVMSELDQGSTAAAWHNSQIEVMGTGQIRIGFWSGSESSISLGTYPFNNWYHVVMAFDNSDNSLKGYVNGTLRNFGTYDKLYPTNLWYAIGAADTTNMGDGTFFDGSIDEVRVYNRVLTPAEVSALYKTNEVRPNRL